MRETKIILIDDIDGSEAVETVYFSVGRDHYEIDLSADHLEEFNKGISQWTENARKIKGLPVRTRAAAASGKSDAAEIRAWAREKGIDVPAKGRIPLQVREQYNAENPA